MSLVETTLSGLAVAGAVFAVSVLALVVVWVATFARVWRTIECSGLLRIPEGTAETGGEQSSTGARSWNGSAAYGHPGISPGIARGHSSGSSSGNGAESPISTSSPPIQSLASGWRERGRRLWAAMKASTPRIFARERASSGFAEGATPRSATPENTPGRQIRRNCRLCSKLRALVAGGESQGAATWWQLPRKLPRMNYQSQQSKNAHKGSESSRPKPKAEARRGSSGLQQRPTSSSGKARTPKGEPVTKSKRSGR